jgi:serine/threonine protein kinase
MATCLISEVEVTVRCGECAHFLFRTFTQLYRKSWFILGFSYKQSSAVDLKENRNVAIKKLSQIFSCKMYAKLTYRELNLLKHIKHDIEKLNIDVSQFNIITLYDIYAKATSKDDLEDL